MKRLLLIILLVAPILCYGQEHLKFMNHPITGDMKEFCKQLENDGFESIHDKFWFESMNAKYFIGNFWLFSSCYVVARKPKKYADVTSVYVRPRNNFLLLDKLISKLDDKYGSHKEEYHDEDVNAINYVWSCDSGKITVFATKIYGQRFDILYQDRVEVMQNNQFYNGIDGDL